MVNNFTGYAEGGPNLSKEKDISTKNFRFFVALEKGHLR